MASKNKYIIRNCDCILSSGKCNVKSLVYCQDCTDCVMKNIVELCKGEQQSGVATNIISNKILKLLDIKEVSK